MNKKDVMALIEYRKNLIFSKKYNQLKDRYSYNSRLDILDYELPEIIELREELLILQKELNCIKDNVRNSIDYVKENKDKVEKINCTHPIVFSYGYVFLKGCYCSLCNKKINSRTFDRVVKLEGDFGDEDEYFYRRYSFDDLYNIVTMILKDKNDEDEINFDYEFLRQFELNNLGDLCIDGKCYKKIYNVLVIGGSNIIKISDSIFMVNNNAININSIIKYLKSIYRINLIVVTSSGLIDDRTLSKGLKKEYNSIQEIEDYLTELKDTNLDLIVDCSVLFDYDIVDNKIVFRNICLNLDDWFLDSTILRLDETKNEIEFYNILVELLVEDKSFGNDFKKLILKK